MYSECDVTETETETCPCISFTHIKKTAIGHLAADGPTAVYVVYTVAASYY